ncbi:MAG: SRPBCC domain-containing protein [Bacteroidales bacterium]
MTTPQPILIEQLLKAPADKVWDAISLREEMRKWYFDLAAFEAIPGFEFQFEGGPEDRIYIHKCRVTEVIPRQKLSYTWRYEGYPGLSTVHFNLSEEGSGTRVRLVHEGLETFPPEPDFAAENFRAGWTHIIQTALKEFLEGSSR